MRTLQDIQREENCGLAKALRIEATERASSLAQAPGSDRPWLRQVLKDAKQAMRYWPRWALRDVSTCDECSGPMPQAYEGDGQHYCAKCAGVVAATVREKVMAGTSKVIYEKRNTTINRCR